jgi:hypothetical protein
VDEELSQIAGQLGDIAERLADLAIDQLRAAVGSPDADAADQVHRERRLTRARRAVERAAALVAGLPEPTEDA